MTSYGRAGPSPAARRHKRSRPMGLVRRVLFNFIDWLSSFARLGQQNAYIVDRMPKFRPTMRQKPRAQDLRSGDPVTAH